MPDDLDQYRNSKKEVGDWLSGGGGTYVQVVGVVLALGFIVFLILSIVS